MPAHTFGTEWLDPLLRSDKQGTTRPQSTRIKVGDIVSIYIKQRQAVSHKPLRTCTEDGKWHIRELMNTRPHYPQIFYDNEGQGMYPHLLDWGAKRVQYHAHFIGKVQITEVFDIHPCEMSRTDMEMWARADGFAFLDVAPAISEMGHRSANDWFTQRYGADWIQRWWTVERWDGWLERYFEPEAL